MRVAILGAGPAGLTLAYLLKRGCPEFRVDVYEQNAQDATFGFGLAFSARALQFLREDDAAIWDAIAPALEWWNDSILIVDGAEIAIDGNAYAGIGRMRLLRCLQALAASAGIEPHYGHAVTALEDAGAADLIVGADGANSLVRASAPELFGTTCEYFSNRFAWFGAPKRFKALGHSFIETPLGFFNAHHHAHAPDMSTFVVEMDERTFQRGGFAAMEAEQSRAACESIFSGVLEGAPLLANKSIWRQFPRIANARSYVGNRVLIGDALRTAHFSIGSGTRLAMEDAIALAKALIEGRDDIPAALASYEAERLPVATKLVAAANASAEWYENFAQHMRLHPLDFAMSYMTRSGRVDYDRLKQNSPAFMAAYEAHAGKTNSGELA